jgi:hypothetical protein
MFEPIDFTERLEYVNNLSSKNGRIVVFGDSFAEYHHNGWVGQLVNQMNIKILSYACPGSSLNYSVQNFFNYLNTDYDKNDFIIFLFTGWGRVPFSLKGYSGKVQCGIIDFKNNLIDEYREEAPDVYDYYVKNKTFWNQCIENNIYSIDDYNNLRELMVSYLNSLPNKVFYFSSFLPFKNINDMCMFDICMLENRQNFDGANHISFENGDIFANLVYGYFMGDKTMSDFNIKMFKP